MKMDDPDVHFFLCSLFLLIVLSPQLVRGFKSEEFRKCNQALFCKEARDRKPGSSDLYVSDIIAQDGFVSAKLLSASESNGTGGALILQMIVYRNGILRVRISEESAFSGGKVRFDVPDVLVKDLEERRLWIQRIATENGGSVFYLSPGHEVMVQHNPFQIHVRTSNEHLVSFNNKGLFHFEQLREKKEGENWEETFRGHRDSRPNGPQSVSFDITFHNAHHVYGIPEHATQMALKPTRGTKEYSEPYRLFNLDVFEYLEESPFGLYGSIPFMLSHKEDRSTGFFWLNAAEMLIDVLAPGWDKEVVDGDTTLASGIDTHWISESGALDAFILVGPSPKDVVKQYTSLTGTTTLPQYFATAYHQCRWNYRDAADVEHVDSKFDEYDIPYDVIWLDIEHTDGKKYFTWDPILFPHPEEMQKSIANKGRHMVTIVDPHIKRDDGYWIHKEATAEGYYVKDTQGRDFDGWCWPGSSSYLDMVNPAIRSWWADKFSLSSYKGSTPILYIWNDMNEPSVFNGPEASMPRDNLHYGGVENRDVHNAYGYYFHMASAEGLFRRGGRNDRPFVLSRAFFAGTQRVGPVWTGDNTADWDHLRVSVPMVLTLGLTGIAFTGADVGGFFGNPEPELLTRWYQLGAFYPFFRAHAHLDTKRREPWLFGEPYTSLIRNAIHTRYALLPYYYTLFKEASVTGVPVLRPLWMEFPEDVSTYAMDDQFMIGQGLLVRGIFAEGISEESVYLPGNEPWYHYETGAKYAGGRHHKLPVNLDSIPVFQKSGTIIPRKDRHRRSTTQMERDPFTLVVALNTSMEAEGELYIDDGKSYDFEMGAFIHRKFIFSKGRLSSSSLHGRNESKKGFFSSSLVERVVILGLKPEGWEGKHRALIESVDQEVDVERGPTILRQGAGSSALIVRMPKVAIVDDWSIELR